ncbi:MAG: hypothetical protein HYR56_25965 [Acidobacteria bacterium]|nr:hypothetical protein [Acidobacteriota bacterium]MBI3427671.1 hypothetical protein [Acidobacteriota bacterium]
MNNFSRIRRWRTRILYTLLTVVLAGACWGYLTYRTQMKPPTTRLALDAVYPAMPPDARHYYLNLPLDYAEANSGQFRAFYLLSPNFQPNGPIVFFFTDGQMELVSPAPDYAFFEAQVPGVSYVLIGHRGHSPTLFPEVYPQGKTDLPRAMKLYGSWQRVEDIERVRRDMLAQGLLPPESKIMIFAASGAGVLAQQYLHRYGEHVSRVLLATTGAPDLAHARGWAYARDFAELNPALAATLNELWATTSVNQASLAYLLFQLGRTGQAGLTAQQRVIQGLHNGNSLLYAWYWLRPQLNWPLCQTLLSAPAADAAKVRMYELLGAELQPAKPTGPLLYRWSREILADYLAQNIALPDLQLERRQFNGEVLVVAGWQDVVFSPAIGRVIAEAYPDGRFLAVRGGHRLELDADYHRALRAAFFQQGLHAAATTTLLANPPQD